jgi:hypothetical protein
MTRIALALLAIFAFNSAQALPELNYCSGTLMQFRGEYYIKIGREFQCNFDDITGPAVAYICSIGHECEVHGLVNYCEDAGECVRITNITLIKSFGGKPARQTGPGID